MKPRILIFDKELAWAAGFFDGEGNIRWNEQSSPGINRTRTYGSIRLQLAQIDRFVLDRFKNAVSVGDVYGPYAARAGNRKPYFVFHASGRDAELAFIKLSPYLSKIKLAQGNTALLHVKQQRARPKLGNGQLGKHRGKYKTHVDPP